MKKKFALLVLMTLVSVFLVSGLVIGATLGDLNDDGDINSTDYIILRNYMLGQDTNINLEAAKLSDDGQIDSMDYILMRQYLLGKINEFPGNQGDMRDISTMELVQDMGIGWNLGNTLEACGDWINGSSVSDYETAWGNPITTKAMIDGIKDSGFKSLRIPVAWSNLMADGYIIYPELMDRVEEVANYALNNDMYVIINIHWDGGWIENASTDYNGTLEKYKAIWQQISERFKNYSDHVIFESMNEQGVFNDVWDRYSGSGDKTAAYNILNNMNQEFVDLVRASGGNNAKRHLLIAGYATDIDLTIDNAYYMPFDPENRLAVSVHYYTPATFTILTEDASWGEAAETWGTQAEIQQLIENMEKVKNHFVDQGIPVIIGEYGATTTNKERESVNRYILTVADTAYHMGMLPMLWDAGEHYNRYNCSFNDSSLASGLEEIADSPR